MKTPGNHGIPQILISVSSSSAVDSSFECANMDVDGLVVRVGKLATIDKLNLSVTLRNRGEQRNLLTSVPLRFLANRADYFGGMGYATAKQVALAIADGTNPVAALDPAIDMWVDIGRYNLRGADRLDIRIVSTSNFSSESVLILAPEARPGTERPLSISKVSSSSIISGAEIQEVWLGIPPGTTYDPYAAADGDLVITRRQGDNSRTCQVKEAFAASSALGDFDVGELKTAALIFEDESGVRGINGTFQAAGSAVGNFEWYVVSKALNAAQAELDRARVVEQVAAGMQAVHDHKPELFRALRAQKGLPSPAQVRARG